MRFFGRIHQVYLHERMIAIRSYGRLLYFYFQTSQMNLFKRYLYEGIYIDLEYNENKILLKKKRQAFVIDYVLQLFSVFSYKKVYYYDQHQINTSLSTFLASLGTIMFLDLEMTMPPYHYSKKDFQAEIIQVGYLLTDATGEEMTRYSQYIRPVLHRHLNTRVQKFLKLDDETFRLQAIDYHVFYDDFKEVLELYHPTVVVYGKNDSISLNHSFRIHRVASLQPLMRFVNLAKLIQNFYHLKSEAGLFKMYQIYYQDPSIQKHDAFNDSEVTKKVFQAFVKEVNHYTDYYDVVRQELEG